MADGKKRTKIVDREVTRDSFISILQAQVRDFQEHVSRVRLQYQALHSHFFSLRSDVLNLKLFEIKYEF